MKNLRFYLSITAVVFFISIHAQDTIYTKSGIEVKAKAIEKSNDQIIFTRFENDISERSRVKTTKIDSIVYENGKVEVFESIAAAKSGLNVSKGIFSTNYYYKENKISQLQFMHLLKSNPEAYEMYTGGQQVNLFGNILGFPSGFYIGYALGEKISGGDFNNKIFVPALIVGVVSMVLNGQGQGKMKNALQLYNSRKPNLESNNLKWEGTKLIWYF